MKLPDWSCASPYLFVASHTAEYRMARSDQDSIGTAGEPSSLIRNAGVKEVWRACANHFQNHSAGNVVSLNYHVTDDVALATLENVESAIFMMTLWERAYKASGTSQAQQFLSPPTSSSHNLVRKVQNWKEWAHTDGSCQIHLGKQVILSLLLLVGPPGAGVYHPEKERPSYVQPNETGITNTIVRAELAAIAAAILRGHSHIATDSLSSLHQIRKQTLSSELHRQHVQGHIL
eukprot:1151125-Pelagomonas_calceolata.AAC.2